MASSTSTFVRVAPHHHQLLELDGVVHCGEDRRATAIDFVQVIKESNQDYLRVTYNLSWHDTKNFGTKSNLYCHSWWNLR